MCVGLISLKTLEDCCTESAFVRIKRGIFYTSEDRVEKKIFELQLIELVIVLNKSLLTMFIRLSFSTARTSS